MNVQRIDTDVLILGTGIAGTKAALEVSKSGKRVALVSKSPLGKATNTTLGGGWFSCATENFTMEDHFNRTMSSGRMINNQALVTRFTMDAPSGIRSLMDLGLKGEYHHRGFRCLSPFLIGGPVISQVLAEACRTSDIGIFENILITDLIVADNRCRGALGFQKRTGEWYAFCAKAVILATGGAGAIYARHDNAPGITGDGYALALKAGLELIDMEFVQFYPLVYAGSGRARMIILSAFADAAMIVNRRGEDIKEKYRLDKKPIAVLSRDRFAQALFREIAQGNGFEGALHMDLLRGDRTQLPYSDELLARFNRKIHYDAGPVKIAPACHHTMGGIPIDICGRTALKGLYAAGEVAGGIHGANRMGGNAYSEGMVFGSLSGRAAVDDIGSAAGHQNFGSMVGETIKKWNRILESGNDKRAPISVVMAKLKRTMWEKGGIVRDEALLKAGVEKIREIFHAMESPFVRTPDDLWRFVECENAAMAGMAIIVSAIARTESRGSHYREDFPSESDEWLSHIHVRMLDERPAVSRVVPI